MTKFLNLKIPVENNLDEIVATLESKGYVKDDTLIDIARYVYTFEDGSFVIYMSNQCGFVLTTLAELKEM